MTYCVAWKEENQIFFIADTAISSVGEDIDCRISSFGELQENCGNKFTYEKHVKIIALSNNVVITFAGDFDHAIEMIQMLDDCLECGLNVQDSLEHVGSSAQYTDVKFIIGFREEDNHRLIYFDHQNILDGGFFEIGSGACVDDWKKIVERVRKLRNPSEHVLPIIIAMLQIDSLRYRMLSFGAGGAFSGLTLNRNGVKWCQDMSYIQFSPKREQMGFVTVINRGGSLLCYSDYNNAIKVMLGYKAEENPDEFRKYIDELRMAETDYIIFTNVFERRLIIFYISKKLHTKMFRLWRRKGTDKDKVDYRLVSSPFLQDLLFTTKYGEDSDMLIHFMELKEIEYMSLVDHVKLGGGFGDIDDLEGFM